MNQFKVGALLSSRFGRTLAFTLLIFTLLPILALIILNGYIIKMQLQDRSVTKWRQLPT